MLGIKASAQLANENENFHIFVQKITDSSGSFNRKAELT